MYLYSKPHYVSSCYYFDYLSLLHKRKTEKGLSASELEMLRKVEGMVEQEFSFALNISRAKIGQYIRDRL